MNNYRVNVKSEKFNIDYWKNFSKMRDFLPVILDIKKEAQNYGIDKFWFFFEPFLEITWISDDKEVSCALAMRIEDMVKSKIDKDASFEHKTPKDGDFGDWFCNNEEEREFGAIRHSICCDWIENYEAHKNGVNNGKGLENQVKRTIHTLCNPLGLNYMDEAKICFSRGLICILFKLFSFKKAVWIYKNVFRQSYWRRVIYFMAQSFLSDSLKEVVNTAYANMHQSFVRQISAYKIGQKIALSSSPTYNAYYRQNASSTELTEVSQVFNARIRYAKMEEEFFTESDGSSSTSINSRIVLPAGSVKLKVDSTGYDYIKDAKRIEFDGKRFAVKHNPRPIGFFEPNYYEFILIPTTE